ncbi:hypothetical protein D3C77_575730 [compost metagenome]
MPGNTAYIVLHPAEHLQISASYTKYLRMATQSRWKTTLTSILESVIPYKERILLYDSNESQPRYLHIFAMFLNLTNLRHSICRLSSVWSSKD